MNKVTKINPKQWPKLCVFKTAPNPLKTKGFHTTPSLTTPPHPVVEVVRDGVVCVLWVGLVVVVCGGLGSSSNVNIDF